MKEILVLIKIGYDNLENHSPEYKEIVAIFCDTLEETAYARLGKYLEKFPPTKLYLGYDKEIYPKYVVQTYYDHED